MQQIGDNEDKLEEYNNVISITIKHINCCEHTSLELWLSQLKVNHYEVMSEART